MKVAIVHEWFTRWAGSEAVLEQILACLPNADLFAITSRPDAEGLSRLGGRKVGTSFLQRLPFAARWPQAYLPWMPLAAELLDLRRYDLVVSNSHCVAKGVITSPDARHLAYVHSPARYAWDLQHEYARRIPRIIRPLWHRQMQSLRTWDTLSSQRPNAIACNSAYISRRIRHAWGRDSQVIYPPVDVGSFTPGATQGDYYITASRLVGYKRVPLIAEAFAAMPERKLRIVGDGPDLNLVRAIANKAKNIEVLGHLPRPSLVAQMQSARAFVFAAEEDFGIAPVEAMACGIPVIAYGHGGAAESVIDGVTGRFFMAQTVESLMQAIESFECAVPLNASTCRERALEFSPSHFREKFNAFLLNNG